MRVVYEPEPQKVPQRPTVSANHYRPGTIVEMEDGGRWVVEWDDQDKRYQWFQTKKRGPNEF